MQRDFIFFVTGIPEEMIIHGKESSFLYASPNHGSNSSDGLAKNSATLRTSWSDRQGSSEDGKIRRSGMVGLMDGWRGRRIGGLMDDG
jgi:hypothetical protein